MTGRLTRGLLWLWTIGVMIFLLGPLVVIAIYAFEKSNIQSWPIAEFSTKWFVAAWHNHEVFTALWLSIRVAVVATALAMALGSAAAFAVHHYRFFGRETVSFVVVLPIALPGVVTGIALSSFFVFFGVGLSYWTIVIGHVTFCTVVVYNTVLSRLKRLPGSLQSASMDLGANIFTTFRRVILPSISTALLAGAVLAFALSFNEVIVTNFTAGARNTLPLWIFGALRLGHELPIVNVIIFVVMLVMLVPLLLSQWLVDRSDGGD